MNEKDFRSRLNAELSNVAWTVRDSNAVRRRVNQGGVKKMKRSFAAVFAMILLLVFMATAAAMNEDVNAWLYKLWPEAALKLMPVNMTCEDQGIRMEVISAVAGNKEMYVTFSLQDLEGNRISSETSVYLDMEDGFFVNDGGIAYDTPEPLYVEDGNKYVFGEHIETQGDIRLRLSKENVKVFLSEMRNYPRRTVDLVPLYREYAGQARAIPVPENAIVHAGYNQDGEALYGTSEGMSPIPADMHVLDSTAGPELKLNDNAYLSGIGMVDGLLHVQIHYVDMQEIPGRSYQTYADVHACSFDGKYRPYINREKLPGGIYGLVWGTWSETSGWKEYWEECIFTLPENEKVGDQKLSMDITTAEDEIKGRWEVEIPVRLIREAN